MIVLSIFLENVSRPEMEEEFVRLTEVVLKFELKRIFNFLTAITFVVAVFFWSYFLLFVTIFLRLLAFNRLEALKRISTAIRARIRPEYLI